MTNELFSFLRSRNIFKGNSRYTHTGDRILASEKTEGRRKDRNRGVIIPFREHIKNTRVIQNR